MPKCAVGEKTAEIIVEVARAHPGRTSSDLAAMTNEAIVASGRNGLSSNLTSISVNSFLTYHPDGQALATERLVARERGKMMPQWADDNTPVAESEIKKAGQLVAFVPTGHTLLDQHYGTAARTMNKLARALPPSRQMDVVSVVNTINHSAATIKLQQAAIDMLQAGRNAPRPAQIGAD